MVTYGDRVLDSLPCQRTILESERAAGWKSHHVGGFVTQTGDGKLYVAFGSNNVVFASSEDAGRTWKTQDMDLPGVQGLVALGDNSLLAPVAKSSAAAPIEFYRSADGGKSWKKISEIPHQPFDVTFIDGNLLRLRDGTLLVPVNHRTHPPEGGDVMQQAIHAGYVLRSTDGGRSWHNRPDSKFWGAMKEAKLAVVGVTPEARFPGPGGMFLGCYEIGLEEISTGTVLGALRYQTGAPWQTPAIISEWNGRLPDSHGSPFKNVLLGESLDGGVTWKNLRPVVDGEGRTLVRKMDTSAELLQLPDGRLVMVIVRRWPYSRCQLIAKVSDDGGRTWSPEDYRVSAGFGYPSSTALPDGTIITATGRTIPKYAGYKMSQQPHRAQVIRWRLREPEGKR